MKTRYENKYFIFDHPYKQGLRLWMFRIRDACKAMWYNFILKQNNEICESKKYNVAICAIFKNEAKYLNEWIAFHELVGVDHFYLYNNNSEDDYGIILKNYVDAGAVTVVEWKKDHSQMEAYLDCIEKYRDEAKWIGFIDIDEFVVPKKTNNLYKILQPFENRGAVKIYWRLYGTSGKRVRDTTGLVIEDFTVCWPKYCDIGKCFYNTSFDIYTEGKMGKAFHHNCWTKYKNYVIPPVNIFGNYCFELSDYVSNNDFSVQINHYFTKSYEEYELKKSRGDVYFKINPHDEKYFYFHEMKCTFVDYSAYRWLIKLKEKLSVNQTKDTRIGTS